MLCFKTVNIAVLLLVMRHVRVDALLCFAGDVWYILHPQGHCTAARIFAMAHALTALLAGPAPLQVALACVVLAARTLPVQAAAYAGIILLNLAVLRTWAALLFVLSDAALAVRDFYRPYPYADWIVLVLYFAAHYATIATTATIATAETTVT